MDFDVFCDESHPDLLASKESSANYMVIGSLWIQRTDREEFKKGIHSLREKHLMGPEFKWGKLSRSRLDFYKDLLSWFWGQGNRLRFRCIVVNKNRVNLLHYHQNDQELGFYKFYYQLLHHWIADFNNYLIFCDYKTNRKPNRLLVLKECLARSNLSAAIAAVQATKSNEAVLLQLADILTGLVASKMNSAISKDGVKHEIISHLEGLMGHPIRSTNYSEEKLNIFTINLRGGWE